MEFDLIKELKNHQPFNASEKEKVEKTIEFLQTQENQFSRTNLKGHVTAGGFVCDENGNVLINRHKNMLFWLQFGGHSDGNSNSLEVAKREIFEESGISDLKLISNKIFDVDVHTVLYSAKKNEPEHLHYDINFLFLTQDGKFKISEESEDIKWVPIKDVLKYIAATSESKVRMGEKMQKLYKESPEIFKY